MTRKKHIAQYQKNPRRYVVTGVLILAIGGLLYTVGTMVAVATFGVADVDEDSSWNLKVMQAGKLAEYSTADGERIAFLDTGISDELEAHLAGRIVAQRNVLDESDDVSDSNGHGTEMVSIACGDGYEGVYGLASSAEIIVVKITDDEGQTDNGKLLSGLKFAQENGATVVNVSLGGHHGSDEVAEQIEQMTGAGVTVVAASGDGGDRDLLFPASSQSVVSVAATQGDYSVWKESNTSDTLTCAFPGYRVNDLDVVDGKLERSEASGTSQACAIASSYIAAYRVFAEQGNLAELKGMLAGLNTLSGEKVDYLAPFEAIDSAAD